MKATLGLQCTVQYFLAKFTVNLSDLAFGFEGQIVFQYPSLGKQAGVYIFILQMQEVFCWRLQTQEPVTGMKFRTEKLLVPGSAVSSQ